MLLTLLSITSAVSSLSVWCDFGYDGTWTHLDDPYQCFSGGWNSPTKNTVLNAIDGNHLGRKTNDDVETISTNGKKTLLHWPKNIEKIFPNLQGIWITESGITEITKEDLKTFPELNSIILNDSKLSRLSSDLFEFNPKLKKIELRNNKISSIGENIFDGLENLEDVNLKGNTCISMKASGKIQIAEMKRLIKEKCQTPGV